MSRTIHLTGVGDHVAVREIDNPPRNTLDGRRRAQPARTGRMSTSCVTVATCRPLRSKIAPADRPRVPTNPRQLKSCRCQSFARIG